jgi:hypothetical protein
MNNDIIVRDWMKQCPYVQDAYARQSGVTKLEYGIYPSAVQKRYHENVLGELVADEIQEALFILTAEIQYRDAAVSRYSFFQNVCDWIEEQNKNHMLPTFNEGMARSVNSRMSQYVSEPNNSMERAEIQIRFTYKRNNN